MKKIALLSIVASTLMMAGGDIEPMEPMVNTPNVSTPSSSSNFGIATGFALLGGVMKLDENENETRDWEAMYGAELSFECLFSSAVRSQLQFTYTEEDDYKIYQLSANPHYMVDLGESTQFGIGPSLGGMMIESELDSDRTDTIFTYGIGASLRTDLTENIFAGVEARYEWTTESDEFADRTFDNAKVFAKIGFQF